MRTKDLIQNLAGTKKIIVEGITRNAEANEIIIAARATKQDCALLVTAADDFFWIFEQVTSYYQFAFINYMGFHDKGMLLAGGCGDTNGKPQID